MSPPPPRPIAVGGGGATPRGIGIQLDSCKTTTNHDAPLGLGKHPMRAADESTIVDSGAASLEIGMTYFIMCLTSHGKMCFLFIRAKIQFFFTDVWKAGVQHGGIHYGWLLVYGVKQQLVP